MMSSGLQVHNEMIKRWQIALPPLSIACYYKL